MARLSLNFSALHIFRPCLNIPQSPLIVANLLILQHHKTPELGNSKGTSSTNGAPPKFPSKDVKKKIDIASFLGALGLLLSLKLHFFGVPMKDHCTHAHAVPSKEARPNGRKSTVVEFNADWCEV
ncbi:Thioredoxin-like protein, chloroplastic [Glycine max]|nr:Thioredoxin-like protein, chloroplastic [Glycine max]